MAKIALDGEMRHFVPLPQELISAPSLLERFLHWNIGTIHVTL